MWQHQLLQNQKINYILYIKKLEDIWVMLYTTHMSSVFLSEQLEKIQELKTLIKQSFQPMPAAQVVPPQGAQAPPQGMPPQGQPQVDPATGMQIDPNTGLLIDPNSGMLVDPASGQMIDPATGQPIVQGAPQQGGQIPASSGVDPSAGAQPPIPDELVQALEEMSAALNQISQKQAAQDELLSNMQNDYNKLRSEIQDAQDLAYDAMKEVRKSRLSV